MEIRKAQSNGNSIAVNIPSKLARAAKILSGNLVEVSLNISNEIIIKPHKTDQEQTKP